MAVVWRSIMLAVSVRLEERDLFSTSLHHFLFASLNPVSSLLRASHGFVFA
jgi:hypothetical protein